MAYTDSGFSKADVFLLDFSHQDSLKKRQNKEA